MARQTLGKYRIVGHSVPSAASCRTPASPTSGRLSIAATSSPNVPSTISVSGFRNRT